MSHARPGLTTCSQYDAALHALSAARQRWAETSVNRRLALLRQIKDALAGIAPAWCPVVFLTDGSLRRVQRTHGFLGVFHQVQQACRVAGVVLGQALGA